MVSFDTSEQFDGYSKVVVVVSDEVEYSAGDDTGRTLTLNCPWGNQDVANNVLESIRGFRYQPMIAEDALIDPAVEIGDGMLANGVYSGVYSLNTRFNSNMPATALAPSDEELDEEYVYIPKTEREVTRKFIDVKTQLKIQDGEISAEVSARESDVSELSGKLSVQADRISTEILERQSDTSTLQSSIIQQSNRITAEIEIRSSETSSLQSTLDLQADEISAKVSKSGGAASSFGWTLTDSSWTIKANNANVLKATKSGLEISGKITASSGKIGGFSIEPNSLSYNSQTWGGTNSTGIYIGPRGIQLGKNFKVDSMGNLTAASGTFSGKVQAGNIQYGKGNGYLPGSGIAQGSVPGSCLQTNTITTTYTSSGINASLGFADYANGVFNGWNKPSWIKSRRFTLGDYEMSWVTINYVDHNGNNRSLRVAAGQ